MASNDATIDALTSSFDASFNVTNRINDPTKPHPRYSLYKNRGDIGNQEKRRQRVLQEQKKRRDDYLSIARDIAYGDIDETDEYQDDLDNEEVEEMDVGEKYRIRKRFKNQLMESEWLVDVPSDLATNYIMVPVPTGRRSFIIAGYGTTCHYSRSGHFINKFPSLLPGGSRKTNRHHSVTFLDCINVNTEQTFYVLDCMIWKDFSLYDCDTECRRFMLQSHLDENDQLGIKSNINPWIFKMLPSFPCDPDSLHTALMSKLSFDPNPLDGLLLYNKQVNYLPGSTPLVGWLKGYMVPELLNVQVSKELMAQRPNSYANMGNYIKEYDEERKNLKKTPEKKSEEKSENNSEQKAEVKSEQKPDIAEME